MTAPDEIRQSPNLRDLLNKLEQSWADEQRRRHEFWADVNENVKAEFILGEIIYHSPIYGRHWKASTRIIRYLIPYVYDNRSGEVGYEKVIIQLTRNDYDRIAEATRYLFLEYANSGRFWTETICFPTARLHC